MDESAAIAIADQVARANFDGRLELLGAGRFDRESLRSSYEDDWREGRFPAEVTEAEFAKFTTTLEFSPRWIVNYLLYLEDDLTVGSVTINEETGATEWDVHERPPK